MNIGAILAGGKGTRVGAAVPKQFLDINGNPIIMITLGALLKSDLFDFIYICVNETWLEYTKKLIKDKYGNALDNKIKIIAGGEERMMSLLNVINDIVENYGANHDDILLTHDAVRPFVSYEILKDCIEKTRKCGVTMASIPVADTIYKSEDKKRLISTYDRKQLWIGQTPSGCRMDLFNDVISSYTHDELMSMTGTSQLFVNKGIEITISLGSVNNIKITTPADIDFANYKTKD